MLRFGHGARHPDARLAQVVGRVEQAIKFFGRQFGTDLRFVPQHGAQVTQNINLPAPRPRQQHLSDE